MSDTSLVFNIIARDSGIGRALGAVERAFKSAGREAEQSLARAGTGTENLDRQIAETQHRVRALSEEFERTGDKTIFGKISRDRSLISNLERMRAAIRDAGKDSDSLGGSTDRLDGVIARAGSAAGGFGSQLSSLGGQMGGVASNVWSLATVALELGAAMTVAAPAIYAVGGAAAALPGLLSGAIAALFTLKLGMSGLAENWKAMNTRKAGGGGGGGKSAAEDLTPKLRAVEAAQRQVARSTRDISDAQVDLRDAIAGVNKAREQEQERIEDVRRSLASARADEEDSVQSLAEAQMALSLAQARGNPDEIRRAQIAVDKQAASLAEAKDKTQDLQKEADEAAKKGVEGSDAVVEAKRRELEAQRRVSDAVQAHKLAVQQLGDAQDQLRKKTAAAGAAAGGLAAQIPKISSNAQDFLNVLKSLKPAFDNLRLDIQQKLFAGLADKLRTLADRWLPALHKSLGDMADTINGVVRSAFDSLSKPEFIANMQTGIDAFRQSLGTIGHAIAGPLVDAWGRLSAAASPFIIMLGNKIAKLITDFSEWIKRIDESGKLSAFMEKAAHVTGKLFDIFTDLARITGDVISILFGSQLGSTDPWDNLAAAVHSVADYLGNPENQAKISKFFDLFRNTAQIFAEFIVAIGAVGSAIAGVVGWFQALPDRAGNAMNALPGALVRGLSAAVYTIGYYIGYGIGWAVQQFRNFPAMVAYAIGALPTVFFRIGIWLIAATGWLYSAMVGVGKNIAIGMWNGIVSMAGWLYAQSRNFAAGIWQGIKHELHIGSPSKVMADQVGRWIPAGIAQGINDNAGVVMEAAYRLAGNLAGMSMALPGVDSGQLADQLNAAANGTIGVTAANRTQRVTVDLNVIGTDGMIKTALRKANRTADMKLA